MKTITLLLTVTTLILTSSSLVSAGDRPPLSAECRECLMGGDRPKPPSECSACSTDNSSSSTNPSNDSNSEAGNDRDETDFGLPGLPDLPDSSDLPGLPGLPDLPGLPGADNDRDETDFDLPGLPGADNDRDETDFDLPDFPGADNDRDETDSDLPGLPGSPSTGDSGSSNDTTSTSSGPRTPNNGLSDTETNFNGAIMLTGGEHVTFRTVGGTDESSDEALQQYAFFAGDTLFSGTTNDAGSVELLSEFFWFETSRERGADCYVGVVKGRTSPNKVDGWRLKYSHEVDALSWLPREGSALMVRLSTDPNQGNAFRWDWSIPFDDYRWDSYGDVFMNASYGLDANAEGSVQAGTKIDASGVQAAGSVQVKGHLAIDSQVTTRYEVTLWRWDLFVNSTSRDLEWNLVLNNGDRDKQNAYHEFFAVMQTQQDVPFEIKEIVVEGHVRKPTPILSFLGVESKEVIRGTASGIMLRSPYSPLQQVDETDETSEATPESEPFAEDPFPEESVEEPEPPPPPHDGSEEIPNDNSNSDADNSDAAPSPFGIEEDVNDDQSDDDLESDEAEGCSAHHTQSSTMSALIMALFVLLVYRRLRSRWFSPSLFE